MNAVLQDWATAVSRSIAPSAAARIVAVVDERLSVDDEAGWAGDPGRGCQPRPQQGERGRHLEGRSGWGLADGRHRVSVGAGVVGGRDHRAGGRPDRHQRRGRFGVVEHVVRRGICSGTLKVIVRSLPATGLASNTVTGSLAEGLGGGSVEGVGDGVGDGVGVALAEGLAAGVGFGGSRRTCTPGVPRRGTS